MTYRGAHAGGMLEFPGAVPGSISRASNFSGIKTGILFTNSAQKHNSNNGFGLSDDNAKFKKKAV